MKCTLSDLFMEGVGYVTGRVDQNDSDTVGGFASSAYWRSSQNGSSVSWAQDFSVGNQNGNGLHSDPE
jgi:hypothetical protein